MKDQQIQIKISGGIAGNRKLLNVLKCQFPQEFPFNTWVIDYPSMREAEECLRSAHKNLEGSYLVSSNRLRYDASVAEIIKKFLNN